MRHRKFSFAILAFGLGLTLLVSCVSSQTSMPVPPVATPLAAEPTSLASHVPMPSAVLTEQISTSTSIPMVTASPTRNVTPTTASSTLTSQPGLAPSVMPTLTTSQRQAYFRNLLKQPTCELPCWWGISPGTSSWTGVADVLTHLGAITSPQPASDDSVYHGVGGFNFEELKIYNKVGFMERSGTIESIDLRSESGLNPIGFQELWAQYSPRILIREYGSPSRVWLESAYNVPVGANDEVGYSLWLLYDKLGFLAGYTGTVKHEATYHFCPRFEQGQDIQSLELFLQAVDSPIPLESLLPVDSLHGPYIHTIEDAAGLSVEQFAALFEQQDKPACFDSPGKIWP
jgi:hypothetical protein